MGWFLHYCTAAGLMRHLVNTIVGFLGMCYFFGFEVVHVIAMASVTWLLLAVIPRD